MASAAISSPSDAGKSKRNLAEGVRAIIRGYFLRPCTAPQQNCPDQRPLYQKTASSCLVSDGDGGSALLVWRAREGSAWHGSARCARTWTWTDLTPSNCCVLCLVLCRSQQFFRATPSPPVEPTACLTALPHRPTTPPPISLQGGHGVR